MAMVDAVKLFSLLSKLVGKQQRMLSVSVYRRADKFFVVTLHGSNGGDPCIEAGPVEALPIYATRAQLGDAVFRGLARTTHKYPYPASQQEWKQITAPLLDASKCKSWSAFAKGSSNLRVNQLDNDLHVLPCTRDTKGAFFPVAERECHFEVPSPEQLGDVVATELEFALTRDGPRS